MFSTFFIETCLRFLLCKVLVVSLIIDFLCKSLREEIF